MSNLSFCSPILEYSDAHQDSVSNFCPELWGRREVYFCGACYEILVTSRRWLRVEEARHLLSERRCPGCGGSALEHLRHREVFFSSMGTESSLLSDLDLVLDGGSYSPMKKEVVFESAVALRGLTAHLKGVDGFVGGLKPGWFVFLRGDGFADRLVERYCVRALLPSSRGGLGGGDVFFIDADMSFDPYSVASLARVSQFSAAEALDRIVIARAFTCYELWSLVAELPRLLKTYGARMVVLSGILSLFASEDDVKQGEAEQILDFVRRRIVDLCREHKVLCVATAGGGGAGRGERSSIAGRLLSHVDVSVEFRVRNRRVYGSLLKHPSRSPEDFWVEEPENRGRRLTLDSFQFQREVAVVG